MPAWGNAPGFVQYQTLSAESAIHPGADLCEINATQALSRAFSAHSEAVNIPGALPQAGDETAPLAPSQAHESAYPFFHLRHLRILSEKLASFVTVFRIEDMLSSLLNRCARLCN